MTLISPVYCTEAEIVRFLSSNAVTDFADNDADGTADTGVVDDCINQATQEIDLYATQRYDQTGLATSTIINRWAVVMASMFLCHRRGNVVPDSIATEWERIQERLQQIAQGTLQLPGVSLRADLRPSFSNLDVDRRRRRSTIRVTPTNSTDAPTALTQDRINEAQGNYWD